MALITEFTYRPDSYPKFRTTVECGWNAVTVDGRTLLRIETYGSEARKIQGKRSQSIEIDETAAAKLMLILQNAFPGIGPQDSE